MTTRARWGIGGVLLALVPFVVTGSFSGPEIWTWLQTGTCPGGPMDRPPRPCGPLGFFFSVFLGGWAAFLVVPALALWWAGCAVGLGVALAYGRRRARRGQPDEGR